MSSAEERQQLGNMPGRMVPLGLTRICVPLLLCLMIARFCSGVGMTSLPYDFKVFTVEEQTYVSESLGALEITVGRPDFDTTTLTVTVAYADQSAEAPNDYSDTVTSINFGPTDTTQILTIPITDDRNVEITEFFAIALSAEGYGLKEVYGYIIDDDSSVPFDCRRFGQDCVSGDCSPNEALCSCPTGVAGDSCDYPTGQVDGTGCSGKSCGSNGRCVSVTGAGFCYCDSGYYSGDDDTCEIKSTTVTSCDNNKMTVCFNPINTGNPLITVSGYTSTDCTAKLVTDIADTEDRIPSDIQGQCITVGFSGDCGTYTIEAKGAEECYTISYYIQYNPLMRTASDEVVYASCCVNAAGETISTHSIEANPATNFVNTQTETTNFFGVRLSLLKSNGLPLEQPVPMSQVFSLCVTVTDEAYDFVGLLSIVARNEDSSRSVQTYANGCYDVGAESIIHRMPYRVNDKKICMEYNPGYFTPGPHEMFFDIDYNLCTSSSQSSCTVETECDAIEVRKRRQAIEEPNMNNAYARVRFEGGQTASESQGAEAVAPPVAECNTTPTMFVAIIATSVIVVLLLLATIVLSCLLMKRRRRKEFDGAVFKTEKRSHKPQY